MKKKNGDIHLLDNVPLLLLSYSSRGWEERSMIHPSGKIGVAILAAGGSSRMGASKLTMPFADTTLLERVVRTALKSRADEVIVVTGSHRAETGLIVEACDGVIEVYNAAWTQGQSSSVIAAVKHSVDAGYEALLLMVADQPFVREEHLNALIAEYRKSRALACVSRVGSRDGSPCLFGRDCFEGLLRLQGDKGARSMYRHWPESLVSYVSFNDSQLFYDIDTPEDMVCIKRLVDNEIR